MRPGPSTIFSARRKGREMTRAKAYRRRRKRMHPENRVRAARLMTLGSWVLLFAGVVLIIVDTLRVLGLIMVALALLIGATGAIYLIHHPHRHSRHPYSGRR
jgi:Flp pilus assembly protein TadB